MRVYVCVDLLPMGCLFVCDVCVCVYAGRVRCVVFDDLAPSSLVGHLLLIGRVMGGGGR